MAKIRRPLLNMRKRNLLGTHFGRYAGWNGLVRSNSAAFGHALGSVRFQGGWTGLENCFYPAAANGNTGLIDCVYGVATAGWTGNVNCAP